MHELENIKGVKKNISLTPLTTFKVGGPAEYYYEPNDIGQFSNIIKSAISSEIPITILSGGSNVLINDNGIKGLVVHPKNDQHSIENTSIYAGAGMSISRLLAICTKNSLSGLEFMGGIPGTVGGGVYGNAGSPKISLGNFIDYIEVINRLGEEQKWSQSDCNFSYRNSRMKKEKTIVMAAKFKLKITDSKIIRTNINIFIDKKNENQPASSASSGCIFKNPANNIAAKLIDQAGLKGKRIGGAEVSKIHANFIINTGSATAEDITILISYIKQQIRDKFNVQLNEEIQYLGF
ncbi:UDP-N-acetylmuramate dehydrogenase [Patescibacteria group bacterium]